MRVHRLLVVSVIVVAALSYPVSADSVSYCYDLSASTDWTFGYQYQRAANINGGSTACGPTSAYNSFVYLQDRYDITGLVGTDAVSTINALSGLMGRPTDPNGNYIDGVTIGGFIAGKKAWIEQVEKANPKNPKIEVHEIDLSLINIYDELKKGQDLEMWINWDDGGAHFVTLTSICWNDTNGDKVFDPGESAKLDFIDPDIAPTGQATKQWATVTWGTGGVLDLQYDSYTALHGSIGHIVAESPVPLPAAVWGGMVLLMAVIKLRRSARIGMAA